VSKRNIANQVLVTDGACAGQINLCGEFDFDTVTPIYAQLLPQVQQGQITCINLSKITASNTAGLGLLLSLLKASKQRGHALTFEYMPQALVAIAAVTGVTHLLSME
jgi:anti-anti-sigma factor